MLNTLVHLVPLSLVLEAEQKCGLLRQPRHPVHLDKFELKTDFHELEATMEKLSKVGNLVIYDLLVV